MARIIKLPTTRGKGDTRTNRVSARPHAVGINVIFTSLDATLTATRAAHKLAAAMNVPLTVVHFRAVHYALPLAERTRMPNAETDALAEQLRNEGIAADVCVCLCRSVHAAAAMTLRPQSLVVVGGRHAWWPLTRAAGWRRALATAGHAVVAVDSSLNRQAIPLNQQITKSPDHQIASFGENFRA